MKYPKYYIYEKLYRRYFLKGVDYFIKEANLTSDDRVLDICGGNGRLTKELIKFSNNISYLDLPFIGEKRDGEHQTIAFLYEQ